MRCHRGPSQQILRHRPLVVRPAAPYLTVLSLLLLLGSLPAPRTRCDVSRRSVDDTLPSTAVVAGGGLGLALATHLDHQPATYTDDDDDDDDWSSRVGNETSVVEKSPTVIVTDTQSYTATSIL